MTMVLITGGIDLSVAAVASLTGMFIAYGNSILGIDPFVCIAFSIVVGVGLGLLMGATIHYLNVPPFITTLTGNFLARGVCSLISRESIPISNEAIDALAGWKITLLPSGGRPVGEDQARGHHQLQRAFVPRHDHHRRYHHAKDALWPQRLRHWRQRAVGQADGPARGAHEGARLRLQRPVLRAGGRGLRALRQVGWNLALQGGELDVISATVIGGTLLTGGVGYMFGTLFGVLLKGTIPALITFNGTLSSWWGKIATGALLLLFILLQRAVVSGSERKKKV